jgi:hypothetical protein
MRVPASTESDWFVLALFVVFAGAISLLVGVLAGAVAGFVAFGILVLAALAWEGTHGEKAPTRLAEAERAGHAAAGDRHRILLVATEAPGPAAFEAVRRHDGDAPVLDVLAPVLQSRTHFVTTDIDREKREAHARLDRVLATARELGITASGEVGDPIDPLASLEDELRRYDVDEVVCCTGRKATWLESAMLHRMRDELSVPVRHVVA